MFSNSSTLFKKQYFSNSLPLNHFRTLLQNTGGVHPNPRSFLLSAPRFGTIFFRIRFFAHDFPLTPIESYSYEKPGGGVALETDAAVPPIHSSQNGKRDALSAWRFLHRLLRHK